MKNLNILKAIKVLLYCSLFIFLGCEEETNTDDYNDGGSGGGSSLTNTVWRGSEDTNTYLKFTSSTVTKCYNGNEVATGTYNSNSITFVVPANGETFVFPLSTYSDYIVVGVPAGFENEFDPEAYYPSSTYPCGGGGGGGGTTGNITFWTQSDHGCGPISVTISNGQTGTINSYFTSGLTSCGASGCANFTLPSGNYSYTATCSGYTWSNSFTITAGSCSLKKLIL